MEKRILIVEDDVAFGKMLQGWFSRNGYEAVVVLRTDQAREEFLRREFSLVLTDLRLPDGEGTELLAWVKERNAAMPVIVMTSYAGVQGAVAAIKAGAFDYLEKPVNPSILKQKIEAALGSPPVQPVGVSASKSKTDGGFRAIRGRSAAARETAEMIRLVAPTRLSVVILGESGTGKEYTARSIHLESDRRERAFVAVDCGSLSRELAPSELFGHRKGSFTSAVADKIGFFQQADGGTIFLDEIGNLSYDVQIQLLRAIQEKKIRPVGAVADVPVDVRIVAATNENLESAVQQGKFREDLYHRINEFTVTVPPLRERPEDISVFAAHFLEEACADMGKKIDSFSPEAMRLLETQRWSGNLRELRNAVRRAALFAGGLTIGREHLSFLSSAPSAAGIPLAIGPADERKRIEAALAQTGGNKARAARLLKIDRKTLYNKMHLYGMEL